VDFFMYAIFTVAVNSGSYIIEFFCWIPQNLPELEQRWNNRPASTSLRLASSDDELF
jgi:hypothetical protein